jgi:hypothetical protein
LSEEEQWQLIHAARRAGLIEHCNLTLVPRYDTLGDIELWCMGCQTIIHPGFDFWDYLQRNLNENDL